jgi:hypothetical protein
MLQAAPVLQAAAATAAAAAAAIVAPRGSISICIALRATAELLQDTLCMRQQQQLLGKRPHCTL